MLDVNFICGSSLLAKLVGPSLAISETARIPSFNARFIYFWGRRFRVVTESALPQKSFRMLVKGKVFARALPFALFILILAIRGQFADRNTISAGLASLWLYLPQALLPVVALVAFRAEYAELRAAPQLLSSLLISIATGIGVFLLWVSPMPGWASLGEPAASFVPINSDGKLIWALIGVRAFGGVLVVPLMEELFWRSFLMRWIDRRDFANFPPNQVSWFSVFASSAVFALAHNLWAAGFLAGLVYAVLYRRLGNLWYSVLAHATTNFALATLVVTQRSWTYW